MRLYKKKIELIFTSLCQRRQWQKSSIWLCPSLDGCFGGFNWQAVAVSANRERPKLGFESEDAWLWWGDQSLSFENDERF